MAARRKMTVVSEDYGGELLGRVATFSVPDEEVNGSQAVRAWAKAGLDPNLLPGLRSAANVFQTACRSVETRRRDNGHSVEVKVDEVLDNSAECVYQITRMVRNRAEKLIDHPKAMRVSFDKTLGTITVDELEDYETLIGIEDAIRAHYEANSEKILGQKVRNAVRDALLGIGSQNLRRKAGGLYFVPVTIGTDAGAGWRTGRADKAATEHKQQQPSKPVLDALKKVLNELFGDRADFYTLPVASDEEMKAMVRKHFVINVNEQASELTLKALNRVREGKSNRGVRSDLLANLINDRRRLMAAKREYEQLIGSEMKELKANLTDLDEALGKLQDLADNAKAA